MNNPYAPKFHFLPEKGWINDPNGLVYFHDTWHLFYQFYDPSQLDGMQWGHAISADLINWEHLPPAISPDRHGQIWSGSAVVDHHDSSGFFDGRAGIVCLFTYWDKDSQYQSQGLAYSADGIHFTTYAGNPVIPQLRYLDDHPDDKDFRDPKVFWHESTQKWIMIVAGGKVRIFSSTDLLHWTFESVDDELHTECPDLFQLPIDGDENQKTWVLSQGGRGYRLGEFDGKRFVPTSPYIPMTFGPDFYAGQSWSDAPDNRRIMISWLFGWRYDSGPRPVKIKNAFPTGEQAGSCLSLPYELCLRNTDAGPRLMQLPVSECSALWQPVSQPASLCVDGEWCVENSSRSCVLHLTIDACHSESLTFSLPTHGGGMLRWGFNRDSRTLFIDRRHCGFENLEKYASVFESEPLAATAPVELQFVIDSCSIELFASRGALHMSAFVLFEEGGQIRCHGSAQLSQIKLAVAQIDASMPV